MYISINEIERVTSDETQEFLNYFIKIARKSRKCTFFVVYNNTDEIMNDFYYNDQQLIKKYKLFLNHGHKLFYRCNNKYHLVYMKGTDTND